MAETLLFNALREAIDEEMARDAHVCVMGEDVGHYGGSYKVTKDLYEKYGELRVLEGVLLHCHGLRDPPNPSCGLHVGGQSAVDLEDCFLKGIT